MRYTREFDLKQRYEIFQGKKYCKYCKIAKDLLEERKRDLRRTKELDKLKQREQSASRQRHAEKQMIELKRHLANKSVQNFLGWFIKDLQADPTTLLLVEYEKAQSGSEEALVESKG